VLWEPPDRCLIVRPTEGGLWDFPGGVVGAAKVAEDVLRDICAKRLGVHLGEVIGQGEFRYEAGGQTARYRYFVCRLPRDEVLPLEYAEVRWVAVDRLVEYAFSPAAEVVVRRLTGEVR